jgi:hypothetical protein
MARIIIGAGAGYFLGLFFTALVASGITFGNSVLDNAAKFTYFDPLMLACVAVGAVMGWAWHSIAVDAGSKDD